MLRGVGKAGSAVSTLRLAVIVLSLKLAFIRALLMQKCTKSEEGWLTSLQKFSRLAASWFLTPHLAAWPYLVGLDLEVHCTAARFYEL